MFIKTRRNTAATNEQVEESGYMASASDLMIGLLFIFIVMVMVLLSRKPEQPPEPPPTHWPPWCTPLGPSCKTRAYR